MLFNETRIERIQLKLGLHICNGMLRFLYTGKKSVLFDAMKWMCDDDDDADDVRLQFTACKTAFDGIEL